MSLEMVHLMTHNLNADLVAWLRANPYLEEGWIKPEQPVVYRSTAKKLKDRVHNKKIDELVTAYRTGVTQRTLAERYGISVSSVKRLLRGRGVRRRPRWDRAA